VHALTGMGKSQLISRWAEGVRARFPGGHFYVDFAALRGRRAGGDVGEALRECLRATGVDDSYMPVGLRELEARFRSRTAERGAVLVVLENVTQEEQVASFAPGAPGSLVLVTSQGPLGKLRTRGARLRFLEPLTAGEGLKVLKWHCEPCPERVTDEPEAAARIVAACAGMPAAIQVAGALLAERPQRSLAGLADELDDEGRRLYVLSLEGDRIVATSFELASAGLPAGAARLYRLLSLCPAPRWDAPLAAVVADTDRDRAAEMLVILRRAGLIVEYSDGRYGFHDLVRLHARSQADTEDEGTVVARVAAHLLELAAYADRTITGKRLRAGGHVERLGGAAGPFPDRKAGLDWLDRWRAELIEVAKAALAHRLNRSALELAEALTALFLTRRYLADWLVSGEVGVSAAVAESDARAEARMRTLLSRPLLDLDERERARRELEQAVARADEDGNVLLRASAREFHGRYFDLHEPGRAIEVYQKAVTLYEEALDEDPRGLPIGLYFLGCAQSTAKQYQVARATLQDALDRFVGLGDGRMGARALAALGTVRGHLGEMSQAVADLGQAADALCGLGATHYEAQAREALAELLALQGETESCGRQLTRALEIYEAGGSPRARELRRRLDPPSDRGAGGDQDSGGGEA
jgi:tetratricopeptide (TPR) repeat protein